MAEYASTLLGSGATCIRLEKNLGRIAAAYALKVETTIMPRHIHLHVSDDCDTVNTIVSTAHSPISFRIIALLSALSWKIADGAVSLEGARRDYKAIVRSDRQNGTALLALVALANASFCRLFGGDVTAMAIVAVATMAGFRLRCTLLRRHVDMRVAVFAAAFVSSVLGATGLLFHLGTTPEVAPGTSVLYLVPGIPFLNSFSDMIYRHYICALSRLMDAIVLTGCLSAGLCAGMALMKAGMF